MDLEELRSLDERAMLVTSRQVEIAPFEPEVAFGDDIAKTKIDVERLLELGGCRIELALFLVYGGQFAQGVCLAGRRPDVLGRRKRLGVFTARGGGFASKHVDFAQPGPGLDAQRTTVRRWQQR